MLRSAIPILFLSVFGLACAEPTVPDLPAERTVSFRSLVLAAPDTVDGYLRVRATFWQMNETPKPGSYALRFTTTSGDEEVVVASDPLCPRREMSLVQLDCFGATIVVSDASRLAAITAEVRALGALVRWSPAPPHEADPTVARWHGDITNFDARRGIEVMRAVSSLRGVEEFRSFWSSPFVSTRNEPLLSLAGPLFVRDAVLRLRPGPVKRRDGILQIGASDTVQVQGVALLPATQALTVVVEQ